MRKINIVNTRATNKRNLWIAVIFVLLATTIFTGVISTSTGNSLYKTEEQISSLKEQKERLNEEMINNQSLTDISQKAESSGFVLPHKLVYVSGTGLASR